jgi:hypothetical protein
VVVAEEEEEEEEEEEDWADVWAGRRFADVLAG